MDALSAHSPYEIVVVQKGRQLGFTEGGNNWLGCSVDKFPGPFNYVMPTTDSLKKNSKIRLNTLFDDTPVLQAKLKPNRSRDSGNTIFLKEFEGGYVNLAGANSAVSLRSVPARYLLADEVDAWPADVDGEGDPLNIILASLDTYGHRKKAYVLSSPTTKGRSRVARFLELSDKRMLFVPCLNCGVGQVLWFKNLKWQAGKAHTVYYECPHCQERLKNDDKTQMLAEGQWQPSQKAKNPKIAGFWLSSLYSPVGWYSWEELAAEWEEAQGKPLALKAVINTRLAELWEEKGEAPPWKDLYHRREQYPIGIVPRGALVVTAAADVQHDRIETEIVGWGRRMESWSIDYRVFYGDTKNLDSAPWKALEELLHESFEHEAGVHLPVRLMAVDSGDQTQTVYMWCRKFSSDKVMAVKGRSSQASILTKPSSVDVKWDGRTYKKGVKLWNIGVDLVKSQLYGWLRYEVPKPEETLPFGYCHFPDYDEEYFKQITAEELVTEINKKGFQRSYWKKIENRSNEGFDNRIYNIAAAVRLALDRLTSNKWDSIEKDVLGLPLKPKKPIASRKKRRGVLSKGVE